MYVIDPSGLHAGAQPPIIGSAGPAAALTMTRWCSSQRAASGVLRAQSDQPGGADAGETRAWQPPSREDVEGELQDDEFDRAVDAGVEER